MGERKKEGRGEDRGAAAVVEAVSGGGRNVQRRRQQGRYEIKLIYIV